MHTVVWLYGIHTAWGHVWLLYGCCMAHTTVVWAHTASKSIHHPYSHTTAFWSILGRCRCSDGLFVGECEPCDAVEALYDTLRPWMTQKKSLCPRYVVTTQHFLVVWAPYIPIQPVRTYSHTTVVWAIQQPYNNHTWSRFVCMAYSHTTVVCIHHTAPYSHTPKSCCMAVWVVERVR